MASEFPKLKKNLNQIQWELDKQLQALITADKIEDVAIIIDESSFVSSSHISKSAYFLREILDECFDESKVKVEDKIDTTIVGEEHISAAEGLLKLGRYSETAVSFLTNVLVLKFGKFTGAPTAKPEDKPKLFKDLKKAASAALSECSSEINKMSNIAQNESSMMFADESKCRLDSTTNQYVSRNSSKWICDAKGNATNV